MLDPMPWDEFLGQLGVATVDALSDGPTFLSLPIGEVRYSHHPRRGSWWFGASVDYPAKLLGQDPFRQWCLQYAAGRKCRIAGAFILEWETEEWFRQPYRPAWGPIKILARINVISSSRHVVCEDRVVSDETVVALPMKNAVAVRLSPNHPPEPADTLVNAVVEWLR